MPGPAADRNLLLGILALQMNFIDRDALLAAMQAWAFDRSKSLGQILEERGALSAARRRLLEPLVDEHIGQHGDVHQSLASLGIDAAAGWTLLSMADGSSAAESVMGASFRSPALGPLVAGIFANHDRAPATDALALQAEIDEAARRNLETLDVPAELSSISKLKVGDKTEYRFGPYLLHERIGAGGMGIVFRATHTQLKRVCALKMIRSGNLSSNKEIERFKVEAEAAARLDHPGIVPIFDVGVHLGQNYFAMAYVDGESLSQRVRGGPLEPKLAAELVRQAALAVQHAHDRGIVHRDIKPANILLTKPSSATPNPAIATPGAGKKADSTPSVNPPHPTPGSGTAGSHGAPAAKLTDFGLAKRLDSDGGEQLTKTGDVMGTPSYMAPEQAAGKVGVVGPLADIYGLGAVLYHLLTGRPPFQAANAHETIMQVLEKEPVSVRELNAAVPRDLQTICHKCLQKDPAKRYASASELAADIHRFQTGEPIQARPVSRTERLVRWSRRNPAVAALSAGILLALGAGVAISSTYAVRADDEARKARSNEAAAVAARRASDAHLYGSNMLLVQSAYESNNIALMTELLGRYDRKFAKGEDPRGFEWFYWKARLQDDLATLVGHAGSVTSVSFSPDGARLASGSFDKTIKLWDARTGPLHATLAGHADAVNSVSFSPDGARLASGSRDRTIKLWDARTGQLRATLTGHAESVTSVSFSPDGARLASGSDDSTIKLWDARTGQLQATLAGHADTVRRVSFSPDGARLASASDDKTIKLWDARTGQLHATLAGHQSSVTSVSFSPDGARLASGSEDNTIKLWDARTDAKSRSEERVRKTVLALFELPMTQAEVIQQIEKGPILPDDLKPSALAMANSMPDDWRRLVKGARNYALFESATPKVRQRAVKLAETVCRLCGVETGAGVIVEKKGADVPRLPEADWALTALGLAQFRLGRTAEAEATLVRRTSANHDEESLCIEAMLLHAVGKADHAAALLNWALESRYDDLESLVRTGFNVVFAEAQKCILGADNRQMRLAELQAAAAAGRRLWADAVSKTDAATTLRKTAGQTDRQKADILAALELLEEPTADELEGRAWPIVKDPKRTADEYRKAVRWAEAGVAADPKNGKILSTLGVAYCRCGQFDKALATLTKSEKMSAETSTSYPASLAFLAIAQHKLGKTAEADATLERCQLAVSHPVHVDSADTQRFLAEAEEVILGPLPTEPLPGPRKAETAKAATPHAAPAKRQSVSAAVCVSG